MTASELWLECSGYEGIYEVSSTGKVRSVSRFVKRSDTGTPVWQEGRELEQCKDKYGYMNVYFCVNQKQKRFRVHRLVAEAFLYNPDLHCPDNPGFDQVNHLDGDKTNNCAGNLEWTDAAGNMDHAKRRGLKAVMPFGQEAYAFTGPVAVLLNGSLLTTAYGSADMVAKGFDPRLVSAVLNGKRKSHKGCTFVKLPAKIQPH